MRKTFIFTVAAPTLVFISTCGMAQAETVGRYDCSVVGAATQDPVGDREGHRITSVQYACVGVDGLLKGALYTESSTSEWDGPKGQYMNGIGVVRAPNGIVVTQVTEGTGSVVMKDGKPMASASGANGSMCPTRPSSPSRTALGAQWCGRFILTTTRSYAASCPEA